MIALRNEKGIALITTLGVTIILTILALGLILVAQNDLVLTLQSKRYTQALHIAEAGLEKALWELKQLKKLPKNLEVENPLGKAYATAQQDLTDTWLWNITSKGVTKDGTERAIKVTVFYLSYWDMFFAGGTSQSLTAGGGGIVGTTSVNGPFFVRGNLQLSGNSAIRIGPLFVRDGDIILTGSSSIGTVGEPIDVFVTGSAPLNSPNFHASSVSHAVPNIVLPDLLLSDMNNHLADAKDESYLPYTNTKYSGAQTDYYKVVDNNLAVTVPLGAGIQNLVINASTPAFGNPLTDDFAWNPTTKTLTVKGTVFVDGSVTFGSPLGVQFDIRYKGNGAIVANGDIHIYGKVLATGSFPDVDILGFVTPTSIYVHTGSSNPADPLLAPPDIQAVLYAKNTIATETNILIKGALVAGTLKFLLPNAHLVCQPNLSYYTPKAMPGGTQYIVKTSGWKETK
ncbi:MAG: hypothetical protein Q8M92_03865, partial [Candidatus Subteraquimicrobiales bacterium]|nr:hypothetical protein [Candidatus Subteraquimicrobiales bacterium]